MAKRRGPLKSAHTTFDVELKLFRTCDADANVPEKMCGSDRAASSAYKCEGAQAVSVASYITADSLKYFQGCRFQRCDGGHEEVQERSDLDC